MNNKQFLTQLSGKCSIDDSQASEHVQTLVKVLQQIWHDGDAVSLSGFGVLEVRKKNERISVNPTTGIRMLVPPKLVLTFKPSSILKEKLK
ncbi:MAG: HU family DNA-binding protein [Bacteroidaceae bacterium]|nr:HU family DNA-binding protein [Bacteroidaceae bacterium]